MGAGFCFWDACLLGRCGKNFALILLRLTGVASASKRALRLIVILRFELGLSPTLQGCELVVEIVERAAHGVERNRRPPKPGIVNPLTSTRYYVGVPNMTDICADCRCCGEIWTAILTLCNTDRPMQEEENFDGRMVALHKVGRRSIRAIS